MFETYFFLFIDSLFASLILPIRSEMVFPTMIIMGGYEKSLIITIALLGSVTGLIINWYIGTKLSFIKKSKSFSDKKTELTKLENNWNKYAIWLLPFAVFNAFGSVLCLFSGFFRTKFWYFLPLVLGGRIIYYFTFS